ncbi:hypothetical protein DFQ27_000070 [Actinomortierella ambigua]|uniref:C3H1-type domain-containing protein n=1 Tax=Actinomortierella ambigua TaxID=1343610 RepID=A0A9P6QNL9_9FUNG|nr:hypothetical protein DFQ27_000070 [Actinomortierella ambigua]
MESSQVEEAQQGRHMRGQIVHARKCYKRLFFIDLRLDESRKYQILFRSDDDELREDPPSAAVIERLAGYGNSGSTKTTLTDVELAKLWKRVRRGDWIELAPFLASKAERDARSYPVFQATDFTVVEAWHGDQSFASEPAIGMEMDDSSSGPPNPSPASEVEDRSRPSEIKASDSWQGLCKFWINSQRCPNKNCMLSHPTGEDLVYERERWVQERLQLKRARAKNADDPHASSSKTPHSGRAFLFCRWLVETFGKDFLNTGTGVLDVAGGRGEISLFLRHMFGVTSTLVEPNVRPDKPYRRKQLMDVIRRRIDMEAGGDGQFYRRDKEQGRTGEACHLEITKAEKRATKKKEKESFVVPHLATMLDDQFAVDHGDLLKGASIILGMHPDQATEPIVDMALKHGKPFAVVPCCVFAVDNPHRRLLDGRSVNTTVEFVEYLVQKTRREAIQAETEFLSFEGMNIVVFRRPGATLAARSQQW